MIQKLKASGKAADSKKKKETKTSVEKVELRYRDRKNLRKHSVPSNKTATA